MKLLWMLSAMTVSIFFLFYGLMTTAEVTGTISQVLGFCGILFTFLYGLLNKKTKKQVHEDKKELPL
ncbi:hypothetical protein [Natribacillus halophilus]|uniref:Uncharacterized protein n=1 Tax=Natribacillus halophilus TaxID=549003 RepID=A0A1G8QAU6_9BACI|nr:hypothetical protein [Natribacillus halophilus]SDJ01595.1 hypothetical protein SAMN04488123_11136 [Natribacillus halophilus]